MDSFDSSHEKTFLQGIVHYGMRPRIQHWRKDQYFLCRDWIRHSLWEILHDKDDDERQRAISAIQDLEELSEETTTTKFPTKQDVMEYDGDWLKLRLRYGLKAVTGWTRSNVQSYILFRRR